MVLSFRFTFSRLVTLGLFVIFENPQALIFIGYINISSCIHQDVLGLGRQNPHRLCPVMLGRKRRNKIPDLDWKPGVGDVKNPKTRSKVGEI